MNQNEVISMSVTWNLPADVSNSGNSITGELYRESMAQTMDLVCLLLTHINIGLINQSGRPS